jgi:ArsR family transcriptional regulator
VSRHLKLLREAGVLERLPRAQPCSIGWPTAARAAGWRSRSEAAAQGDATLLLDRQRLDAIRAERVASAAAYFRKNAARWGERCARCMSTRSVEAELLAPAAGRGRRRPAGHRHGHRPHPRAGGRAGRPRHRPTSRATC